MRILFVGQELPWPADIGARQRAFHLARVLARRHEVDVVAPHNDVPPDDVIEAFRRASGCGEVTVLRNDDCAFRVDPAYGDWPSVPLAVRTLVDSTVPTRVRRWRSPKLARALAELAASGRYDAVWAVRVWMAEQAFEAGFPRVIVDVDDLSTAIERQTLATSGWYKRRPLHVLEAWKTHWYERRLPHRYAGVVMAKEEDRAFFPPALRGRVHVVPNGVLVPPHPAPPPARADSFLFVGTLGYWPNVDAIQWFAGEVLPRVWRERPDARFTVAGLGSGAHLADALADPRCTLVESPPDLAPLYAQAAVAVAPVRLGGGTRIKILEALAHGRPLVATAFAAEGFGLRDGEHLSLADDPEAMARRCVELLGDADRRAALGAAGRAYVAERYAWDAREQVADEVVRAAARRPRTAAAQQLARA